MQHRSARSDRGFSLVEVLVANVILAVGVLSVAQLFTVAIASNITAARRTEAAILASQKLEELRAMPWGSEQGSGNTDAPGIYARRWSIAPLPGDPVRSVVLQVRVSWNGVDAAHLVTAKTKRAP